MAGGQQTLNSSLPRIALTLGEPAGIGPDLCIRIAQQVRDADIVAVADPMLLRSRAEILGLPLRIERYEPGVGRSAGTPGTIKLLAVPLSGSAACGQLDPSHARYVLATLRRAAHGCLAGEFDALVTGPVHKGLINQAGITFTGHTEFLAELTAARHPVMMLTAPGLRVALVTTHLPLAEVSAAITRESLATVVRTLHRDLQRLYAIPDPHILVCGLNPHAGEGGHLGREEVETIAPVLEVLRTEGMRLSGPLPADTLFTPRYLDTADAVLAMYHDQGLPVLKHVGFGRAVNVTLGLPIIRTSVDHGTAIELAGTGRADTGSLEAAIAAAVELVTRRQNA